MLPLTPHPPARPVEALLIRNPVARHPIAPAQLARVLQVARDAGWRIEAVATEAPAHATALARDAVARGVDVIVVHGGDGTVNEVVNGIAGTRVALAVLRGGTANVWAKETRCAKDPVVSMRAIVGGVRRRVDLGRAGGRYFLLMCGIGLDAEIIPRVGARMKRRLGALAYIIAGLATILRRRSDRARIVVDGVARESSVYWMLAGNTRSYGGVVNLTPRAAADDGLLDIAIMKRGGALRLAMAGALVLLRRQQRSANLSYETARTVDFETPGISVQVDGELHGTTPVRIEVAPGALLVVVPARLRTPLFRQPPAGPVGRVGGP